MRFEREILLKTGERCLLRSAGAADAAEVLDSFIKVHGETDCLLSYPDENTHTVEGEEKFLAAAEESDRNAFIIAVIDGKVVGDAGIDPVGNREKNRHRADFGISVLKEHWGKGIGRALTEACIECARRAGYSQLELEVVSGNFPAISLYRSFGFTEYGRNPRGFRSRYSGWQELVLMRLELDRTSL